MKGKDLLGWLVILAGIVLLCFTLMGCDTHDNIYSKNLKPINQLLINDANGVYQFKINYTIVVIEDCEYFVCETTHGFGIFSHKGNCKNPIHNHIKE